MSATYFMDIAVSHLPRLRADLAANKGPLGLILVEKVEGSDYASGGLIIERWKVTDEGADPSLKDRLVEIRIEALTSLRFGSQYHITERRIIA